MSADIVFFLSQTESKRQVMSKVISPQRIFVPERLISLFLSVSFCLSFRVPLERGSSEGFRQREARAARLASEIEASAQYRHRVALENDEGRTEEDKYSAVVRDGGERERGRDSPGFSSSGSRSVCHIAQLPYGCASCSLCVYITFSLFIVDFS